MRNLVLPQIKKLFFIKTGSLSTQKIRRYYCFLLVSICFLITNISYAQLTLTGTSYSQNFDGLGSGLPTGWTVRTSATTSSLGSTSTLSTDTWASTSGNFRNVAAAETPQTSGSSTAVQNAASDRALAVRPSGSFGDPGAAFTLQIANTTGKVNFSLILKHMMFDAQPRTTNYVVEYTTVAAGTSGWTTLNTFTTSGSWGSTSSGALSFGSALNEIGNNVWIRVRGGASTGSGSRDTYGIDDFVLSWSNAGTPSITPTPSSLTGLTYIQGSGPSTASSFTLAASNLTAGGGTITINGSTDYEVSTTSSTTGFGTSATLSYTGTGTISPNTVWVRLKAGLSTGTYNSQSIGISGGGASTSVTVSGSVTAPPSPALTPSPATLTGITYVEGSGPSTASSFTLSSNNYLTGGGGTITINGSTNYEVSTTSSTTGFGSSATLSYTGTGTISPNTAWVRLKAGLTTGNYNSETISISGGGASTSVTVSGFVTIVNDNCSGAIELTLNGSPVTGNVTGATQSIAAITCATFSGNANDDIWYSFTTAIAGTYVITVDGDASFDAVVDLRSGACNGTNINCADATTNGGLETISTSLSASTTYYIRVYDYDGDVPSTPTFTIAVAAPIPGLSTNGTTSLSFGDQIELTNSSSQSFDLSGSNLTGFPDNITVSVPNANFQLSNNNSTWGSSTTIAYTSATLSATPVYVRFAPQSTGVKSGDITFSGGGVATPPTIALSGIGILASPVATTASDITENSFTTNWNGVSGATEYRLDVYTLATGVNVVSWDFPDNPDDATADGGVAANASKIITATGVSGFNFNNGGATSNSANATSWNSGSGSKYWEVEFTTEGFSNLKVSSKQRGSNTAPRDFKIQYKIGSGGTYTDVPEAPAITVANNYTSGVLEQVLLPEICENQSSVYLRWIMTSNTSINNGTVASGGSANIDDILIEGDNFTYVYEDINVSNVTAYPVSGLNANTTYYYNVRAIDANSTSANSNTVSVLTVNPEGTGDYRSANPGNFTNPANWQFRDYGTHYTTASSAPTSSNSISILHDINLDDDFTVGAGKTFTISGAGTLSIASGKTFTVDGAADFGNKSVTIVSDENGTAAIGKINGTLINADNVTVQRFIASGRTWRLLTAPVSASQNIFNSWQIGGAEYDAELNAGQGMFITGTAANPATNGLDPSNRNSPSMYYYNAGTQALSPVNNTLTTNISDHSGYTVFVRGDRNENNLNSTNTSSNTVLSATGTLRTGQQQIMAEPGQKLTLIGNPYASPVDLGSVSANGQLENLKDYYWVYSNHNGGGYVTVDRDDVEDPYTYNPPVTGMTEIIQSGQAFYAISTPASVAASITFEEIDKVSSSNYLGMFRPSNVLVTASLSASLYLLNNDGSTAIADGASAKYKDGYSKEVTSEDVIKFSNIKETLSLIRDNVKLAVEKRPVIQDFNDSLFFDLTGTTARKYRLVLSASAMNHPGLAGFFEDKRLGTRTPIDLNGTTTIDFTIVNPTEDVNRFSIVFTMNSGGPVPVKYSSIKAWQLGNDNKVTVEWQVENEINIKGYQVESSADGINFTAIGNMIAINNSGIYSYTDEHAFAANNFYRIISIGNDGKAEYSTVVRIKIDNMLSGISVYPNPVIGDMVNLQLTKMPKGKYPIRLLNNAGQTLLTDVLIKNDQNTTETIKLPAGMSKGVYTLEIIKTDNSTTTFKLMRQ